MGNDWAMMYFLLGGREAGKSYATTKLFVNQWKKYGRPFYWLKLKEASSKKLLENNAIKLVDADLRRQYNLDLVTSNDMVYEVTKRDSKGKILEKKMMARVLCLSTFYNDKGSALFDKDFLSDPNMYYNICLDEMNKEKGERRTFDIIYSFVNQMENLIRSTKRRVRIICIGNELEDASELMLGLNFLPNEFGRYYLVKNKRKLTQMLNELNNAKSEKEVKEINKRYSDIDFGKRAVVEYIPLNEAYRNRRHGTIADIMTPNASTFTNRRVIDTSHIYSGKLNKPTQVIKFSKESNDWFTLWDGNVIAEYKGEKINSTIYMAPFCDGFFDHKLRDQVCMRFLTQGYMFKNLLAQRKFQKEIEFLKPRG